jgi:CMP-N-acetylneuraminic acid synthetase
VIPARGGSKRLPRKNIQSLLGRPLIAYTIEAARKADSLSDFLVSTEEGEILRIAQSCGAPTPFLRPKELAEDQVRNNETVYHAMEFMENEKGVQYDILVLLQPTCPIRNPQHIDEAVNQLWTSDLDTAVSVKGPFKKRDPILKAIRKGVVEDYCPVKDEENVEPFYLYNASIYAVKREYFVRERKLISPRQAPILMDQLHSLDIDTEEDLFLVEASLRYLATLRK